MADSQDVTEGERAGAGRQARPWSRGGSSAARSPERSRTPATRRRRAHQFGVVDAPSTKPDEARPCGIEDVSFAVGHGRFSLVPCQLAEALDQAGGQLTLLRASAQVAQSTARSARPHTLMPQPAQVYFSFDTVRGRSRRATTGTSQPVPRKALAACSNGPPSET